jgi:hypothetical protein
VTGSKVFGSIRSESHVCHLQKPHTPLKAGLWLNQRAHNNPQQCLRANVQNEESMKPYIGTIQKECSNLLGSDNTLKRTLSDIECALLVCEI